jgi:hypothetical protein
LIRALPAALLAGVVLFPLAFTLPFPRHIMIMIFLYGALATAWNIIAGYCGQISLGQAVFFGIGAYTSSLLFKTIGLTPWVGMIAGRRPCRDRLADHRVSRVPSARSLFRHRHHRGGRDRAVPHHQLGTRSAAPGACSSRSSGRTVS